MVDLVDFELELRGDVVANELESRMVQPNLNVALVAAETVVHADHNVVLILHQAEQTTRRQSQSGTNGSSRQPGVRFGLRNGGGG
jgi:hypothetical protein